MKECMISTNTKHVLYVGYCYIYSNTGQTGHPLRSSYLNGGLGNKQGNKCYLLSVLFQNYTINFTFHIQTPESSYVLWIKEQVSLRNINKMCYVLVACFCFCFFTALC